MTRSASLQAITAFWAAYLGCRRAQLSRAGTAVVRNGPGLAGYHGATAFYRPPACVLAVPADWYQHATARLAHQPAAATFDAALLRRVFGPAVEQVVGPAWLGYADHSDFRPSHPMGTRRLTNDDLPALRELAAACGPTAWAHSGIDPGRPPAYGCYAGRILAAAGMLEPWGDRLLHVGIVTRPAYRPRLRHRGRQRDDRRRACGRPRGAVPDAASQPPVGCDCHQARLPALRPYPRRPAYRYLSRRRQRLPGPNQGAQRLHNRANVA